MGDSDSARISEGKFVIIQRGDSQRIVQFQSHQTITYGKGQSQQDVQLQNALNEEFYSAFRILPLSQRDSESEQITPTERNNKSGKLKLFSLEKIKEPASKFFSLQFEAPLLEKSSGKDNRNLVDDRSSQPLAQSDIYELKDQGLSSKEILSTIVSNSKSFAQKTEFSQEKYLKKKEKIHGDVLIFLEPDLNSIAEYFFKRDPARVLGLRNDTISQILSYANIHCAGRYIIYENANSILVAAILQRMGGCGILLHCHAGTNPQKQAITYLNLSEDTLKPLRSLDAFYLIRGRGKPISSTTNESNNISCDPEPPAKKKKCIDDDETRVDDAQGVTMELDEKEREKQNPPSASRQENEKSLELLSVPFEGLVICGKEHPLSIFQRLIPHLRLSSPFVVYSPYPEPLIECYMWTKEKSFGANMHIVDNWLRNIQVEPERTHPEINMSSGGGYILYGTYVNE